MNTARYTKIIFAIVIFCLIILALIFSAQYYINQRILQNRVEIEQLVRQKIGLPVTIQSIQSRWLFLSVGLGLKDVRIYAPNDSSKTIPIAEMDLLEVRANLFNLMLKEKKAFNHVVLRGLKIKLSLDEKKGPVLLGLNGEDLKMGESTLNPLQFFALEKITIKQGQIYWKRPGTEILQRFNGTFSSDDHKKTIEFKGRQEITLIGDKTQSFTLPTRPLQFFIDADKKTFALSMDLLGINIDCKAHGEPQTALQCRLQGKNIDLKTLHQQIHLKKGDPEWMQWLFASIQNGKINQLNLNIDGPIENLKTHGKLTFQDVDFRFSPHWPTIQKAEGQLEIIDHWIKIKINEGLMNNAAIVANATVGPLKDPNARIDIKGHAQGTLNEGLEMLQKSPLKDALGTKIAPLNPKGPMELDLNLNLPIQPTIENSNSIKVNGSLKTSGAELRLSGIDLLVEDFVGEFTFTEQKINAKELKANILERPFSGDIQDNKVNIHGIIDAAFLQQHFPDQPWQNRIAGESHFNISYLNELWQIESDLEGIRIDLPAPLGKEPSQKVPFILSFFPMVKEEQKVSLNLKNILDAKGFLTIKNDHDTQRISSCDEAQAKASSGAYKLVCEQRAEPATKSQLERRRVYQIKRGHLVFGGQSDWTNKRSILIGGTLNHINVKEWEDFFEKQDGLLKNLPLSIHILVNDLEFLGINFRNTWLDFTASKGGMAWILDGPMIKGSIKIPTNKQDEFKFALDRLKITIDSDHETSLKEFISKDKPPISFFCHELIVGERSLGQVSFKLMPKELGYDIQDFSIKTNAYLLEGHGQWQSEGESPKTILAGDVYSNNMGSAFSQWGYSSAIQEARGQIQFDFQWPGSPMQFSLKDVEGSAIIHLKNGRILGVNPGLGKILSLLSLEKIPQRLFLDFSDLYKDGFVFDTLDGKLTFANGFAHTEAFDVSGPQADIHFSGKAELSTKNVDLYMAVAPKMSGSLPLAAGLATGNPAIGLGVWAFSKIVGPKMDPIGAMTKHNYHVTGTWDAPHLQKIGDNGRSRSGAR